MGVAPIVMVIASVVTFSVHMNLGFDLTAAQVRKTTSVDAQGPWGLDLDFPPII